MVILADWAPRIALSLAVVFSAAATLAQAPPELPPFSGEGKIEAVAPGLIKAQVGDTSQLIKLAPNAKVMVTGTAESSFLRPGLFVRFRTEFDAKGKPTAPLEELDLVTPVEGNTPGVFPDGMSEQPKDAKRQAAGGTFLVFGRIKEFNEKKRQLSVVAGRAPVRVDLAENPTIKVELADLSMISAGDAIKVTGKSVTAESVLAEEVAVTLANVLAGPKKKERRTARNKSAKEDSPFKPLDVKQ